MVDQDFLTQTSVRQDPEAKLLLLTAKSNLNSTQSAEAKKLAEQVTDWDFFTATADLKFSVTYAHRALSRCASQTVPDAVLGNLKRLSKKTGLQALKIAAAQLAFHKTCIEKTNAQHAYLKGIALSVQNFQNLSDRFCRDIDVLVSADDIGHVIETAHLGGYRVLLTVDPVQFAESDRDIKFVSRHAGVVMLLSPDNVLIEVHRRIDKGSLKFDLKTALSTTETIEVSGVKMQTLARPLHFVYACYHHTRHYWSHLHWLADLDAMVRSPEFDRHAVLAQADTLGIKPTIEGALQFHTLVARSGLWNESDLNSGLAGEFLKACLANLEGGLELEYRLRENKFLHDFISDSQISPKKYSASGRIHWWSKLSPNIAQYLKRPYPVELFWLYRVEMAYILFRDALRFGSDGASNTVTEEHNPSSGASGHQNEKTT